MDWLIDWLTDNHLCAKSSFCLTTFMCVFCACVYRVMNRLKLFLFIIVSRLLKTTVMIRFVHWGPVKTSFVPFLVRQQLDQMMIRPDNILPRRCHVCSFFLLCYQWLTTLLLNMAGVSHVVDAASAGYVHQVCTDLNLPDSRSLLTLLSMGPYGEQSQLGLHLKLVRAWVLYQNAAPYRSQICNELTGVTLIAFWSVILASSGSNAILLLFGCCKSPDFTNFSYINPTEYKYFPLPPIVGLPKPWPGSRVSWPGTIYHIHVRQCDNFLKIVFNYCGTLIKFTNKHICYSVHITSFTTNITVMNQCIRNNVT